MIFNDYYADIPEDALEKFITSHALCRFVTASADGQPHIGLYPYIYLGKTIEIHLHRADEQLVDLRTNKKCVLEVDEIHGTIPSNWVHPTNGMFATAYHRTVIFECDAEVSEDHAVLAEQQARLMAIYQPEGNHKPVTADAAMYRGPFNEIAALTLTVRQRKVKWKLAQNRDRSAREKIIANLRARGRPTDAGAADALQWTLDHEAAK